MLSSCLDNNARIQSLENLQQFLNDSIYKLRLELYGMPYRYLGQTIFYFTI